MRKTLSLRNKLTEYLYKMRKNFKEFAATSILLFRGIQCTLRISRVDLSFFSLEKSFSEVFGSIKLHKKNLETYLFIFHLRKLYRLRGQCCSTALEIDSFYVKYSELFS